MISNRHVIRRWGKPPTLQEAQSLVGGGLVELMTLPNGDQLLFNEDGRAKKFPRNEEASRLARLQIVGPALLLQRSARWV